MEERGIFDEMLELIPRGNFGGIPGRSLGVLLIETLEELMGKKPGGIPEESLW